MPPVTAVWACNVPMLNRERTAINVRKRYAAEFIVEPPQITTDNGAFI
jgi:hypothetical protein